MSQGTNAGGRGGGGKEVSEPRANLLIHSIKPSLLNDSQHRLYSVPVDLHALSFFSLIAFSIIFHLRTTMCALPALPASLPLGFFPFSHYERTSTEGKKALALIFYSPPPIWQKATEAGKNVNNTVALALATL